MRFRRARQVPVTPTYNPYQFVPVQVPVNAPPPLAPDGYTNPYQINPMQGHPNQHVPNHRRNKRIKRVIGIFGWVLGISIIIGLGPIAWFVGPLFMWSFRNSVWKKGNGFTAQDARTFYHAPTHRRNWNRRF